MRFSIARAPALRGAGMAQSSKYWIAGLAMILAGPALAVEPSAVDSSVLPQSAYRIPLQEVIVIGGTPYWKKEQQPQWEREEIELKESKARMQWAPAYTRDERDEYDGIRDSVNPKARAKVFEVKF